MVRIVNFSALRDPQKRPVTAKVDQIFFQASARQSFESEETKTAFHWLWLGRYLEQEPEHAFVAVCDEGGKSLNTGDVRVCGYLVGSLSDPAPRAAFAELGYFKVFAPHTARFPAHLHINIDQAYRGLGIGAQLVDAFVQHISNRGVGGVHIVTGKGMRNVQFYSQQRFAAVAEAPWKGGRVVMMGRMVQE